MLNRQMIIDAAVDLFGYSESDFDDMPTRADVEEYLLDSQLAEINKYLGE